MNSPAWIKSECCENYWCVIHEQHVYDCPCPPIEEWTDDPYTTGAETDVQDQQGS